MHKFYPLILDHDFNHRKVGLEAKSEEFEFYRNTPVEELFDPATLPQGPAEIQVSGIPFRLPDTSGCCYDNIACEGQLISFPASTPVVCHVLGFCDMSHFFERLEFYREGILQGETELFLQDSWQGMEPFNYAIQSDTCHFALLAKTTVVSPRGIYRCSMPLDTAGKQLDALKLPFNPNMHVMAVTLEE